MRTFKFRGKHVNCMVQCANQEGTWIYGYLCDKNYILSKEFEGEMLIDENTAGQYTEIKDYYGVDIYEGDIILSKAMSADGNDFVGVVKYYDGCFVIDNCKDAIPLFSEVDIRIVIGNIYDNKELLEGNK